MGVPFEALLPYGIIVAVRSSFPSRNKAAGKLIDGM